MDKRFIITRQGKDFILYEGLLHEAHQQGLSRISTTVIQIPSDNNSWMAVVSAEVQTSKGTFSGIGDAHPQNVNKMILPHILRMAETRAKARALRDAVNIGATAFEELGDFEGPNGDVAHPATETNGRHSPAELHQPDIPRASPNKPASANQLATIAKLSRMLGHPEEPDETMNSAQASERITALSQEYNERKTPHDTGLRSDQESKPTPASPPKNGQRNPARVQAEALGRALSDMNGTGPNHELMSATKRLGLTAAFQDLKPEEWTLVAAELKTQLGLKQSGAAEPAQPEEEGVI